LDGATLADVVAAPAPAVRVLQPPRPHRSPTP